MSLRQLISAHVSELIEFFALICGVILLANIVYLSHEKPPKNYMYRYMNIKKTGYREDVV